MEEINVVVATIAFGMGIDKPDVRYVIHYNLPKSLENYYQETGRCGRDGGEGECLLFYQKEDVQKFQSFNSRKNVSEKEISTQLLEEMIAYVEGTDCRRKKLLHYFGEDYKKSSCKTKCDNCKHPKVYKDVQNELKIILDFIIEINNNFDTKQLISLLQGTRPSAIKYTKFFKSSYFNVFQQLKAEHIQQVIRKAILENLIKKDISSSNKLKITNQGKLFLQNPNPFLIIERTEIKEKQPASSFDNQLFVVLNKVRQDIAKKNNIPPFIIFQDPSLKEMAIQYPISSEELKNIIGVGEGKIKKYGPPFIDAIKQHVSNNNITKVSSFVVKSKAKKNDLKIFIIQSADRKLAFEDIIDQKKISMNQLITEIENIVHSGTKINIDYHIDHMLDEVQQEEIHEYFINEADNDSVDDAKKYFDDEYEEEEIRLMKIKLFSDLAN